MFAFEKVSCSVSFEKQNLVVRANLDFALLHQTITRKAASNDKGSLFSAVYEPKVTALKNPINLNFFGP